MSSFSVVEMSFTPQGEACSKTIGKNLSQEKALALAEKFNCSQDLISDVIKSYTVKRKE